MKPVFTFLFILMTNWMYSQCSFDINLTGTDPTCFGSADGSVMTQVSNGTAPYTYLWNNGATTPDLTNLPAGCYDLTVTDDTGCAEPATICLNESPPLIVDATAPPITCAGEFVQVDAIVTGGIGGPYEFYWSDGQVGSPVILTGGMYSVTVIDLNGCTAVTTLIIDELAPIDVTIDTEDGACDGSAGGSATINVIGGSAPYTYEFNGIFTINPMLSDLAPGIYEILITDANGCTATQSFEIFSSLYFEVSTTTASCDGSDGTAEVSIVTSSSSNLEYAWSTGSTTATESGLAQGWYSVTVTDLDEPCTVHRNFYIDEDLSCKVVLGGYVINDDINPDCVDDAGAVRLENRMMILDNGLATFTDADGYYEFILDAGTYDVEMVLTNQYEALCPASAISTVSLPTDGMVSDDNDFYVEYAPYQDVCVSVVMGLARPGFPISYFLNTCNIGGETVTNGTVTFTHDSLLIDIVFDPPADSYDPLTYTATWNYTDFEPNECFILSMDATVPVGTPLGTLIDGEITADPVATDDNPTNNVSEWHQTVTGSYDPNDKRGFIGDSNEWGGDILEDDVSFNYNLRFQNVGTDTAFTVVVRDTLDLTVFDIESIQPGPSSHPYSLQFEDDNVLVFWFENIYLVDSTTNEPASNGFASFTISRFPNLPIGTEIKNSAAIFFDFNAPVITNTTIHTISNPLSISEPELDIDANIYPNPITDETVVSYQLEKAETVSISVIDQLGRTCFTLLENEKQTGGDYTLELSGEDLTPGVYLLQITTADGQVSKKFLK